MAFSTHPPMPRALLGSACSCVPRAAHASPPPMHASCPLLGSAHPCMLRALRSDLQVLRRLLDLYLRTPAALVAFFTLNKNKQPLLGEAKGEVLKQLIGEYSERANRLMRGEGPPPPASPPGQQPDQSRDASQATKQQPATSASSSTQALASVQAGGDPERAQALACAQSILSLSSFSSLHGSGAAAAEAAAASRDALTLQSVYGNAQGDVAVALERLAGAAPGLAEAVAAGHMDASVARETILTLIAGMLDNRQAKMAEADARELKARMAGNLMWLCSHSMIQCRSPEGTPPLGHLGPAKLLGDRTELLPRCIPCTGSTPEGVTDTLLQGEWSLHISHKAWHQVGG